MELFLHRAAAVLGYRGLVPALPNMKMHRMCYYWLSLTGTMSVTIPPYSALGSGLGVPKVSQCNHLSTLGTGYGGETLRESEARG